MRNHLAKDMSRKLQERLGAVLGQEVALAKVMIEGSDVGIMLIEASVMLIRSTAATLASMAEPDRVEATHDLIVASIFEAVHQGRSKCLAAVRENIGAAA